MSIVTIEKDVLDNLLSRVADLEASQEMHSFAGDGMSDEKKLYLRNLATATRSGDKEALKNHNRFVSEFYARHGVEADWPVPNIL